MTEAWKVGESYADMLRGMSDEVIRAEALSTLQHLSAAGLDADRDVVAELLLRYMRGIDGGDVTRADTDGTEDRR